MKKLYRVVFILCLSVLSLHAFSQGFIPKTQTPIKRLKSATDLSLTYALRNLFTFPAGVDETGVDVTAVATITVTSNNPAVIQANGTTFQGGTWVSYIVKGSNVTGAATLTITVDYNGIVTSNTMVFEVAHVVTTDEAASVAPGGFVLIDVLANDQPSASINPSTLEIVTQPTSGTATIVDDQSKKKIKYVSNAGASNWSADVLTYRVADNSGNFSSPGKVTIAVNLNPYVTKLFEYKPAPGQFINKTPWGTTAIAAPNLFGAPNGSGVSLGGFGGYVILGFDQPIKNSPQNRYGVDFTVSGNAFASWTEPASVMVMKDVNGNGLPDDTWYELAGSEYYFLPAKKIEMTYINPRYNVGRDVIWTTDIGTVGVLRDNTFHNQPYYPQPDIFSNVNGDRQKYDGTQIKIRVNRSNPSFITSGPMTFGYADNKPNNPTPGNPRNPYIADANGASADGFDLSWAVDANGNSVQLDEVHFVKIYNSAQEDAGWLGEASSEIDAVTITTPDPSWVPQDVLVQLIASAPFQVLKGKTHKFEGLLFKNGLPQKNIPGTWSVSNEAIGTISQDGTFTALSNGSVTIQYSADSNVPIATSTIDVVEVAGIVLTVSTPNIFTGEQTYVQAEGIDSRVGANRFIYDSYTYAVDNTSLAEISDKGIVTGKAAGVVTITVTSVTNPSIQKTATVTIAQAPQISVAANASNFTYPQGTVTARIDLNTIFSVTGGGQVFNSVKSNSNDFMVQGSIEGYRYLNLTFKTDAAGQAVLTTSVTAYGVTTDYPITITVTPKATEVKAKQIVFVNGGQFGSKNGNVQIYDPIANTTTKLADFSKAQSVQDIVVDDKYAYVSAEYDIIKYDLVTKTEVAKRYLEDTDPLTADGGGTDGMGLNHTTVIYKDWILATRQNSYGPPEDGYNVRIYKKSDLSLVKKIPVSTQAAGIVIAGDSAFVALNGGFMGATGQLAIIDLINLQKKEEFDFGADGVSIMQLVQKDKKIYALAEGKILTYSIKGHSYELHNIDIGHADYSSSPMAATIVGNKLYAKTNLGNGDKGFGIVDLDTYAITTGDLIGMSTNPDITNNGYALMASAYDKEAKKFYFTFGQWWGNGIGRIYTDAGAAAGTFDHVEDSPERMVVSYGVVYHAPYAFKAIPALTAYEDLTYTIDLNTYFKDEDQDVLTYTVTLSDRSALPAWITKTGSVLTIAPKEGVADADWLLKVVAADANESASQEFHVLSKPVDDAPFVKNVIADVTVDQSASPRTIDLANTFDDIDSDVSQIVLSVENNTNTTLVQTSLVNKSLTLSFAPSLSGTSIITIKAVSDGKSATTSFNVKVNHVDEAPVVSAAIADVVVNENAAAKSISLENVFKDDDSDLSAMTYSVTANSNTGLITTSISGKTLTLSFGANKFGEGSITVTALSDGKTVSISFKVTVSHLDKAPVVVTPIAALTVEENAPDHVIDLTGFFADEDSDVSKMMYAITANTNAALVTTSVNGNKITLSFKKDTFGESDVTVQATSDGKTVATSFKVTVKQSTTTGLPAEDVLISAYPNPVVDEIHLTLNTTSETTIQLIGTNGAVVNSQLTTANEVSIDMRNAASGVYILYIKNNSGEVIKRIVKQ